MGTVTVEDEVIEEVEEAVALTGAIATVTVRGPFQAHVVVTDWKVEVGGLQGMTQGSSVSIS